MAKDILQAPFSCLGQGLYASVFQDIKEGKKKKKWLFGRVERGDYFHGFVCLFCGEPC